MYNNTCAVRTRYEWKFIHWNTSSTTACICLQWVDSNGSYFYENLKDKTRTRLNHINKRLHFCCHKWPWSNWDVTISRQILHVTISLIIVLNSLLNLSHLSFSLAISAIIQWNQIMTINHRCVGYSDRPTFLCHYYRPSGNMLHAILCKLVNRIFRAFIWIFVN